MWMSSQRARMEGLLETEWRDHWSYESKSGSKVVYERPKNNTKKSGEGIDVYEEEEMLEDYVEDEVLPVLTLLAAVIFSFIALALALMVACQEGHLAC